MRARERAKRGTRFVAGGAVLSAAALYFAFDPDQGWLYALLFTAPPAVFAYVLGIRELILAWRERPDIDP